MVRISPELINCFKWDRILQHVQWVDGHKLIFCICHAWLVCAGGGCEVHWSVPHTVNLQLLSSEVLQPHNRINVTFTTEVSQQHKGTNS